MSDLLDRIAHLPPEKRKLFERLLKQEGVDLARTRITPQPRSSNTLPLSFAQQRLWFLDQFAPNSPFYNIPSAVRLTGRLDVAALERSIQTIVQRHETLRTTFTTVDEQPMQVIAPPETVRVALRITDLTQVAADQRAAEVHRLATAEAQQPFDLEHGPLLRLGLLRLQADEHVALFTMHHIISDGWSMGVLIREVGTLYSAFAAGNDPRLAPLAIQYADYAQWQRQWLQGDVLDEQIGYWRRQLRPEGTRELSALALPTDRPRPAVQTYNGARYPVTIPRSLVDELKALSQREGATLFMTLLATFQVVLARYSGQDDIAVGTPVAGRTHAETEALIGCFINTLVLRTDLAGNPSFRALLGRVRETALGAFSHQHVPFETLVEVLQPERDMSRSALFQVMFILQNTPVMAQRLPDLTLEPVESDSGTATFDLTLGLAEAPDGLTGSIEYNTDLFDAATIARFAEHWITLLGSVIADPDRSIATLPLLSDAEQQLLREWNATVAPFPQDRCVHQLFELQAAQTPGATAVVWGEQQHSYDQLNTRANQLAHHLRLLGVGPDVLVGLCLERSLDLVVAVLGVLKAGGAYVPLDPAYPPDRLQFMLDDAQIAVLLTQERLLVKLLQSQGGPQAIQTVCLDRDWQRIAQHDATNPLSSATGNNLAYAIFTSGSTGQAKGVLVEHRSLTNIYYAWEQAYQLRSGARCHLQMANFAFDVFTGDLVRALCSGAKLVLCPQELLLSPPQLYALMLREGVDAAEFVPAVLRLLIQHLEQHDLRLDFMRLLVCGSDSWYAEEYARFKQVCGPQTRLINSFGLTEATIDSCFFEAAPHDLHTEQIVPIGRPFANTTLYVLDQHQQPVPIGVPGELYIGGAGVARGYLNRAALTAERFIDVDTLSVIDSGVSASGARLYRTGDLVRYRADGNLEYLGRADQQIKLRGFRIELGEIEAALGAHPELQAAVVLVRNNPRGEHNLVAYVVPGEHTPTVSDLRSFVQDRLPEYMLPAIFMVLPALPLTANGKIDRRALPSPDWSQRALDGDFVAPRTVIEELLANIWSEVLGVNKVGVHDNFFELGGHSLLATQLVSRVRGALSIELPLRTIFEAPTVATLAERIERDQQTTHVQADPIQPVPRDGELPLSFTQQRLWFFDQLEPHSPLYNIPDALRLSGQLDIAAMQHSLDTIVRRHEILRTTFPTVDGRPTQVIAPELSLALPIIDLSSLPTHEREAEALRRATEEAQQPFDLATGPLLRATLLRLQDDEHVALFTMHHIIADGWSTGVLVREIATLYPALVAGQPVPLPALAVQYADYAHWQRRYLQGDVLDAQLAYWTEQLRASPPLLELPTDRPRPAVQTYNGAHQRFVLPARLTDALNTLSQREGATLFMTLLAAFNVLLHRYSTQDDIAVGTPIANRTRAETEALVGCFINTLVLRTDLAGNPDFCTLLQRTRETALGAYTHQDLPFELLVDALQPERNLSYTPLFQVMFILQNTPSANLALPGLTLGPVEASSSVAMFDLTLTLQETPDGLLGDMEYNTDLFDATTIGRMVRHFELLLGGIVADPAQPIAALPLLLPDERHQMLVTWNETAAPLPDQPCIHHLIAAQAQRTPDALAVRFPATAEQPAATLRYRELDEHANQLAHHLRERGVGPDVLVGVCVPRSLELMIALLGVLKAGGAYVPLDPSYPAARLQFMLDDAQIALVLTHHAVAATLDAALSASPATRPTLIALDADWPQIAAHPRTPPEVATTPDDLAYVIYTSGSTGQPKGVLVPHRAVVNHNLAMIERFDLHAADRVLQFATINFDAAVEEIFPTWLCGATLVLRPDALLTGTSDLLRLVEREQIRVLDLPTAYWHALVYELELLDLALPASLRLVIVGGEAASAERLANWQRRAGAQVRWLNTYGPTETTVVATVYEHAAEQPIPARIPIGRPIANTQLYVLDTQMQPAPIGVPGELYIGGAGVARGYLNQPELTATRFVERTWTIGDGANTGDATIQQRVYRTGDLVRYRADGNLEYLGRVDQQVKLRGFRIEPGEIEAQLMRHSDVREAAVIVHTDERDHQRLVAYIVPAAAALPAPSDLRAFLQTLLPDYMLPSAFVPLAELPRTPSGKIDRRALPAPDQPTLDQPTSAEPSAPHTDAQATLAQIWQDVLGVPSVGLDDNFFALGGDSILSIQVIARAHQAGLHLTPKQFFQQPTIAALAAVAGATRTVHAEQGIVTGDVPLTPIQRWFFEQNFPTAQHWNQALLLTVREPLERARLEAAVAQLVQHHDALRLRFTRNDGGWQQHNAGLSESIPVAWIDLGAVLENEQRSAIERAATEMQQSLDLAEGPLLRVAYFDLGPGRDGRLLIAVHHLAIDGVSWRILLEDFQRISTQLSQGEAIELPAKTTSYQHWARRLVDYAQTPTVQAELEHWLQAQQSASLPRDLPLGSNSEASAATIAARLTAAETQALLQEVPAAYGTEINDVLLTALAQTVWGWTGASALAVELEGHGREDIFDDADLSRTVGWFTTIFPVQLTLPATGGPGAALKAIKEQLRRVPNRGFGYGLLRYLSADTATAAQLAALSQPEISFNYLGQFDTMLSVTPIFGAAPEQRGPDRDPQAQRSHVLELTASIVGGALQIEWTYSAALHRHDTIARLADQYLANLRALIAHCQNPDAAGYTPSDFPLADLDQHKLDKVFAKLNRTKGKSSR